MNLDKRQSAVPAYGRAVIDARRRREPVNLFVYCGTRCWDLAQVRQHAVAVPSLQAGQKIDWRPIAGGLPGITLVARGWDAPAVETLARILILAGAKLVTAIRVDSTGEQPRISAEFYRRSVSRAPK